MFVHAESTAVEALYRAYYEQLCAFATLYVRCPDAAADIVQDVFLQLWTQDAGVETWSRPSGYLFSAVRNRALNYVEHEQVVNSSHAMMQTVGLVPALSRPPAPADEMLEAAELELAFERAIDHLPARCREAYVQRNDGKTPAEIAAAMGTSVRTAHTQVTRARQCLRRELECWL